MGEDGLLVSYERRPDFAEIARDNVERFFGGPHPAWQLRVGDLMEVTGEGAEPAAGRARSRPTPSGLRILSTGWYWTCWRHGSSRAWQPSALIPGGVLCCYVATVTQLSRTVESIREQASFDEPVAWESMVRGWHVDGLAVRPEHRMVGHTGFLITARRLAEGITAPPRRRRPAKGSREESDQ